jgi:DNA primase catalytic core
MARISKQAIEQINEEVSLVRLAELAGVKLHPQGKELIGTCPFHADGGSSLVVSPEANAWRCIGGCESGGSVIEWTMRAEGVSFAHAIELLRDGALPSKPRSRSTRSTVAKLPPLLPADTGERELLERVVDFYAETLREDPEALAYLERRGLGDPALRERFRLGYANRTLGYRLPARNRKAGAELRGKLAALGIMRPSGHEHLAGSLVVPICDEDGAVVQLYGRKVSEALRVGTPRHLYLPGPRRGVFNEGALRSGSEAIVCESLVDALTFWANGMRNVTATAGPEELGEELPAALAASGTKRVLIAFDADEEGERGAEALAARLDEEGIECSRVRFPAGEDANSFACASQEPASALAQLVSDAGPVGEEASAEADATAEEEAIEPPSWEEGEWESDTPEPTPLPPAPREEVVVEAVGDELRVEVAERRWRVRGVGKATSFEAMRVNLFVAREHPRRGEVFHVDSLDLYSARARGAFARQAGEELGISEERVTRDMGRVLLACEEHAEQAVRDAQAPSDPEVELSEAERERALSLLRDPNLIERIGADFASVGVVGEGSNCLIGYLAAVSRKLDRPLAVIVQSTSAAGKSALQEAVLAMVPSEDRVSFSAMTGQSLFYMGETDLSHKVLAIAEEEGAKRAAYALKLLHSEGELRIASTGKEGQSGRLITHTYTVRGPVAIFLTTTTIDIDEELLNRCIVLSVDEEREQTRAIHERQRERETLEGLLAERERASVLELHRNAQRLLEPLAVVNPYARQLTFADVRTRTRRDHMKYLALIRAIALLHQHQRPKREATTPSGEQVPYIEVTRSDIVLANRLAHAVLGRSLDELPPGTRRLLGLIEGHVEARADAGRTPRDQVRFTRRELRESLGWGDTQLKLHLSRLVSLELIWAHRGPHGSYLYELAWDGGSEEGPRLPGLIDAERLGADEEPDQSGSGEDRAGGGRAPVAVWSGDGRPALEEGD